MKIQKFHAWYIRIWGRCECGSRRDGDGRCIRFGKSEGYGIDVIAQTDMLAYGWGLAHDRGLTAEGAAEIRHRANNGADLNVIAPLLVPFVSVDA